MSGIAITVLDAAQAERHLHGLAAILVDAVAGGASVSFMLPFGQEQALGFWRLVHERVARGETILLGAFRGERLEGTVQLHLALPPNQPHRAEIAKLLVHSRARGGGIAKALMEAAETEAAARGRTLLTLDTLAGTAAERLYQRLGYVRVGEIPGYALLPDGEGGPRATVIFYKQLRGR